MASPCEPDLRPPARAHMQLAPPRHAPTPTVVGTGFVGLDVLVNERRIQRPRQSTGGTCGNVLTILGSLGWTAYPVARLKRDSACDFIRKDLRRWNIDLRLLSLPPLAPTPIVVHRLRKTVDGHNFHSFSLTCPRCATRLPRFRP